MQPFRIVSLSTFRGSPPTPEMLCGLRLQGPLLMHPAVALGSALTARGQRAGPFGPSLGPLGGPFGPALGRALRAQVQQQDTYFLFFYRKEEERKGNWPFLGAAAQMALRIPLEVHFEHFWCLLPKWLSGSLWRLILSISEPCCPNGSQEASEGSF